MSIVISPQSHHRSPALAERDGQPQGFPSESDIAADARRIILVADDNRDSTNTLCTLLRALGHDAYAAYDGSQAIEQAAKLSPDLVLLDISMPNIDGYDAARAIRQQKLGKRPILVAVTGWGQDEDLQRTWQAGFDYHFVKPVDPDGIFELLS